MARKGKHPTMKVTRLSNRTQKIAKNERLYFHRYKLTNSEYHRVDSAVSSSALKELHQSKNPRQCYRKYIEHSVEHKQSDALVLGAATHKYILERLAFKNEFAVWDKGRRAGKEWQEFKDQHSDKTIITGDQMADIKEMYEAVYACPEARQLLSGGEAEHSVFWRDEETGVLCKARADYVKMHKGTRIIVDVKTCRTAEPEQFAKDLINLGYPVQEAHYREGFSYDENGNFVDVMFAFIAIEKETNTVQVYTLDEGFDEAGHFLWRQTLNKWAEHLETDTWGTYAEGVTELKCPDWWINRVLAYE